MVLIPLKLLPNEVAKVFSTVVGNFKSIYDNSELKKEFYKFLKNVFNIFPEDDFHKLISETTAQGSNDQEIYTIVQSRIKEIKPLFSALTYQLPALQKQKDVMARQSLELLGANENFNGYLEIGSSGRYLDYLEEKVNIKGNRYYADGIINGTSHANAPGYSIPEMIDRGQICVGADYIPMTDYNTNFSKLIKNEGLDLVTVYIGFHHCPLDLRIPYISSIRDTLRVGGKLILRDHDCDTEDQKILVGLAHDVFNLGVNETWEYNKNEVRNFYSLDFICDFVERLGFKPDGRTLFQKGDPTKNALMLFTKI